MSVFCSVEEAVDEIRKGSVVIVVDDEGRENEGDMILAAEKVTPEKINFLSKHARGLVCLAMTPERSKELDLPPMVRESTAKLGTAFTVSIDLIEGTTTGISAFDRVRDDSRGDRPEAQGPGTSRDRDTFSRSRRTRGGCCGGPATPRRRSIWRRSRGSTLRVCCAK